MQRIPVFKLAFGGFLISILTLSALPAAGRDACKGLPSHADMRDALTASVAQIRTDQVGLGN